MEMRRNEEAWMESVYPTRWLRKCVVVPLSNMLHVACCMLHVVVLHVER